MLFADLLLLALPYRLGADGLLVAKAGGVAFAAAVASLLVSERRLRPLAGGAAVALLGADPALAVHAVSGMETALDVAMTTAYLVVPSAPRGTPRPPRTGCSRSRGSCSR